MKRISLQWRITLMTAALIAVTCISMNFLVYGSGLYYMEYIADFFEPEQAALPQFTEEEIYFEPEFADEEEPVAVIFITAQERYRFTNWCITGIVTLLSGVIAYFVAGRALKPLHGFVAQAEQVQLTNIAEVRIDAETVPEFTQLSYAFNAMLNRLEQGFAAQRQFTGNAAHELRTPLALMQAKLELFRQEHPQLPPETDAFLTDLQEQLERLTKLAKTLLDMSDLQSIPRNQYIHMAPLIEEVWMDVAPLAEKKEISLRASGDAGIFCSDLLMYRLLFNLTENAIKYNVPGGWVDISVEQRENLVQLRIANTGAVIPQEYQTSIFQPFFRVDKSRSRALGGAGLGLPMVKEIARLHGGDAWVEESTEKGTVFLVTLAAEQNQTIGKGKGDSL